MFRLRTGYLISGIITGLVVLFSFFTTLPDGKLHVVFCNVGQGDAAYVRFPDGRDMLVDGGPNNKVLECLGKHMPFWDRQLDMVLLTHPQKDHMQGLIEVLRRYEVGYFARSEVDNTTEGYRELLTLIKDKNIPVRFMVQGEGINVGPSTLSFVWPSAQQIASARIRSRLSLEREIDKTSSVLGSQTIGDLNDYSLVFWLRYGSFDVLFTGDADSHVESGFRWRPLPDKQVEVLKFPHHGSKTGASASFLDWLKPQLAVISVGKNSYGHPAPETLEMLSGRNIKTIRTDEAGDIEVVSDGKSWDVKSMRN